MPLAPTTNMNLVLPVPTQDPGPGWASTLNAALGIVDAHDHSPGKGVAVPSTGININADLPFNGLNATLMRSLRFSPQAAPIALGTDLGCLYEVGGNLYFNNGAGAPVQITAGAAVNSSVSGAFAASIITTYPYTISSGDAQNVLVIDTTATRTINLPTATTAVLCIIKDGKGLAGSQNISLVPNGTNTIDGQNATFLLGSNWGAWLIISDGISNWSIVQLPGKSGYSNKAAVFDGNGNIVSGQDIRTSANVQFAGLVLSGLSQNRSVATDGANNLISGQDLRTSATPSFAGLTLSGDITYTSASFLLHSSTADAADTATLGISPGGAVAINRGAIITMSGNEATNPGIMQLQSGNAANARVDIIANGTGSSLSFGANGRFGDVTLSNAGDLANNTGGMFLTAAGKSYSLLDNVQTPCVYTGDTGISVADSSSSRTYVDYGKFSMLCWGFACGVTQTGTGKFFTVQLPANADHLQTHLVNLTVGGVNTTFVAQVNFGENILRFYRQDGANLTSALYVGQFSHIYHHS